MAKKLTYQNFIVGIKILGKHLLDHSREIKTLLFLAIGGAIAEGSVPWIAGKFFDSLLPAANTLTLPTIKLSLILLLAWLIVQLAAAIIGWIGSIRNKKLGAILYTEYLAKGFSHLLYLPLDFHKKHNIGAVGNKIQRAAEGLRVIGSNIIVELAPQFLSIIVGLAIVFAVDYRFAGILVAGLVLFILAVFKIAGPTVVLQRKLNHLWGTAWITAYEGSENIQAVKHAVSENFEWRRIFSNFAKVGRVWYGQSQIWEHLGFSQRLIITATQAVIFLLSIYLVAGREITIGELFMFNGYAAMIFGPFVRIGYNWNTIQNGLVNIEEGESLLNQQTEIYEPKNKIIITEIKGDIKFKDASFKYEGGKEVLRDISFEVKPGEIVALVGKSGEGKSTLIDLISGYYFAQKGQVLIDGHNVKNLDLKFLRSQIAVVPQEVVLFNDTIETNIKYGSFGASSEQIEKAAEQAHALEFIAKFPKKWKQVVGERGVKLSVGQKQRVAIARAILRDPKILILDEPTSALDAESEHFITKSLEELMRGRTTFIIAHRLSTVRKADKIIVIDGGQVVETGRHDELIARENGVYRRLYELQVGLHE